MRNKIYFGGLILALILSFVVSIFICSEYYYLKDRIYIIERENQEMKRLLIGLIYFVKYDNNSKKYIY